MMVSRVVPYVLLASPVVYAGDVSVVATAPATVVDEAEMSRVLAEAKPGVLVVFDIDNTLITPLGHLGSDEWYDWLFERGVAAGLPSDVASKRADDAFNRWQGRVAVRSVDPATPSVLAKLRARGVPFFALTARSPGARETTVTQLSSLGLQMSAPFDADVGSKAKALLGKGSAYRDGIFFIGEGGLTKGEALLRILAASGTKPGRIIFVDDKARNTGTVDESLTAAGIPHLCLRFSRKDAEVKAFREDMANEPELATGLVAPSVTAAN